MSTPARLTSRTSRLWTMLACATLPGVLATVSWVTIGFFPGGRLYGLVALPGLLVGLKLLGPFARPKLATFTLSLMPVVLSVALATLVGSSGEGGTGIVSCVASLVTFVAIVVCCLYSVDPAPQGSRRRAPRPRDEANPRTPRRPLRKRKRSAHRHD